MNKHGYLTALSKELKGLPQGEYDSLMFEYESHFEDGALDGRSDTEIMNELGDPVQVGKELRAMYHVTKAKSDPSTSNVAQMIFSIVGLSFLNLFVLLIPFIIYVSIMVAFAFGALMMVLSPIFLVMDVIFNGMQAVNLFEIFMTVFCVGFGLLFGLALLKVMQFVNRFIVKYIKFNKNIIQGGYES
ncbi:HAAS signaling domain-containing protein [Macrococcus sp. EM39E]|uniref:HAAS signaling domain-containing protein n=1 Tax=Macrococcus animalis TaxID=3395467 RepID=UPI0039BF3181